MNSVKIRLLNDGGYDFLDGVKFPVEVEVFEQGLMGGFYVETSELESIGASSIVRCNPHHDAGWYFLEEECEVVPK